MFWLVSKHAIPPLDLGISDRHSCVPRYILILLDLDHLLCSDAPTTKLNTFKWDLHEFTFAQGLTSHPSYYNVLVRSLI